MRKTFIYTALAGVLVFASCNDENAEDIVSIVETTEVTRLSEPMQKVRDYVPSFAVIAHRGTTYWTPEETEAAYRLARELGADYLECDLQCSKDGVILALHDDDLKRTTNIETVYGDSLPETRRQYYIDYCGMTETEALLQCEKDRADFIPYRACSYTYAELIKLDAGTWFNEANQEQARKSFSTIHQYISTLEDLVNFARGNRLARDNNNERIYQITPSDSSSNPVYTFAYVKDTISGNSTFGTNRPGIYLEFKDPVLNPESFELAVYTKLDELGFNIITSPEPSDAPRYKDGHINIGNTNGKTVLQTFSKEILQRSADIFQGKIPMCFLLWKGDGVNDLHDATPSEYASFINYAIENKAHIIGPSIAGEPNDYPELNDPWMAALVHKAGMLIHPYTFDTISQMEKYFTNATESDIPCLQSPYLDGAFTNRTELTIRYFTDQGVRSSPGSPNSLSPENILRLLGYE